MANDWYDRDFLCFDTETTGISVAQDRIVTATCARVGKAGIVFKRNWLINPGIPIPAEAAKIHGVTTEKAQTDGVSPTVALGDIAQSLWDGWNSGCILVAMNAAYDLSILSYELDRHGLLPIEIGPVIDPLVLDRHFDKFRKGKRNLTALAQHYGVRLDDAHSSEGDALAAGRVAWAIKRHPVYRGTLSAMSLDDLQRLQAEAHREWAEHYQSYLRSKGQADAVIETDWPVRRKAA